ERVQPPGLAVHAHAAGLDQLVGAAAGGDAGASEVGVESHGAEATSAHGFRQARRPCKDCHVPHYVSLIRWTSQGRMGLPAWRDRVEDGERMIEEAGGKLVGVWVTLGRYDVVEIFEAPSDDVALEIVTRLQAIGGEQTETLRAFTREEAEEIIKRL